jgi:hypothetical protein
MVITGATALDPSKRLTSGIKRSGLPAAAKVLVNQDRKLARVNQTRTMDTNGTAVKVLYVLFSHL